MNETFDWNDIAKRRLSDLWVEGHSTTEIGRRLGVSKNAIIGKAHRLGLPARPSPVRKAGHQTAAAPKQRPRLKRVPTLPSFAAAIPASDRATAASAAPPATKQAYAAPSLARRSSVVREGARCCWPIGEPGTRSFRYCDGPLDGRGPYCTEHVQVAYVRRRPQLTDAAMLPTE